MAMKTYQGSCHCGDVRYTAAFDLSKGTAKCNCSICIKARIWHVVLKEQDFVLLSDPGLLTDYTRVAPGQSAPRLHMFSCRRCSVGLYSSGDFGSGKFYAINVMTLDDLDPDDLAAAPVKYQDGRHDRWDRVPEDIRLL
jgi:hypothetical protein